MISRNGVCKAPRKHPMLRSCHSTDSCKESYANKCHRTHGCKSYSQACSSIPEVKMRVAPIHCIHLKKRPNDAHTQRMLFELNDAYLHECQRLSCTCMLFSHSAAVGRRRSGPRPGKVRPKGQNSIAVLEGLQRLQGRCSTDSTKYKHLAFNTLSALVSVHTHTHTLHGLRPLPGQVLGAWSVWCRYCSVLWT